jgi:hypothetical protein
LWQTSGDENEHEHEHETNDKDDNDADDSSDDDDENKEIFYDDFADFGGGLIGSSGSSSSSSSSFLGSAGDNKSSYSSSPASTPSTALQERIRQVQSQEIQKDTQMLHNWRSGNWQVRGFSLDPDSADADEMDESVPRIHACRIVVDQSSDSDHHTANNNANSGGCVWVGRTNGEMVRVQLGSDYWTRFSSKLTATMQDTTNTAETETETEPKNNDDDINDNDDDDSASGSINIQVSSQLENAETSTSSQSSSPSSSSPFEILNQFPAHDAPVAAVLSLESYLFTTAVNSGSIQQWLVTEDEDDNNDNDNVNMSNKIVPLRLLQGAHSDSDTVVCLKPVRMKSDNDNDDASVLFSASQDGSLALWDIKGGDLLYKCQMTEPNTDLPVRITSADVDTVETCDVNGPNVFVGTDTGQVWAYHVADWMESAAQGLGQGALLDVDSPIRPGPIPAGQWTASTTSPITSLSCAGPGSLGRGANSPSSSLLLTGAADGVVKQWEVFSRPGASSSSSGSGSIDNDTNKVPLPSIRLEHWPKLPTQRLPKKAHLFRGHDMEVTALLPVDATKFLSASKDGTVRAWNPATGKEYFRMDGFTEALQSLCLQEDMLITDGMKQFVCVHDFDVDPDENGWELDYEED